MSRAVHIAPWTKCSYCTKVEFADSSQFVRHLREVHCSQEGGSFVCHYGDNNICYSLPVVGVNDVDYEKHVYQHHTLGLTSPAGSSLPTEDKKPSEKWTVYSASQFLPSVLNDPTKSTPRDFFTKTWGDNFVENAVIHGSQYLPPVPKALFEQYLRRFGKRHKKHLRLVELSSRPHGHFELLQNFPHLKVGKYDTQRADVNSIPKIFLSASFNLNNVATFNEVFPHIVDAPEDTSSHQVETRAAQSNKLLQEKLSHYLDLVEVQIAQQVSQKSEAFFHAMTSHDAIMEQLSHNVSLVRTLRDKLSCVDSSLSTNSLHVLKKERLRSHYIIVHRKLRLMATVLQTQPTIQLLLSGADYTGALELMDATQELLAEELAGIHSLRHLSSELREMENVIDTLMAEELEALSTSLIAGEPSAEARLPALLAGMARRNHSAVATILKAAVSSALRFDSTVSAPEGGEAWVNRVGVAANHSVLVLGRVSAACEVADKYDGLASAAAELKAHATECASEAVAGLLAAGWPPGRSAPAHLAALALHIDNLDQAISALVPSISPTAARSAFKVQAGKCLTLFDRERVQKVLMVLESEPWRRSDVPAGFQALADGIAERGDFRAASAAASGPTRVALEVDNTKFAVPATALFLLDTVAEYCAFAEDFPSGADTLLRHLAMLLKQFNSRCFSLVLKGRAVSGRTGLKKITAAHLALALRTLNLVGWLVPHVRIHFVGLGADRYLEDLDTILVNLQGHAKHVHAKLVDVVKSTLALVMVEWEPKPPVPTKSLQAVLHHLRKFHDAVHQLLPRDIVQDLFMKVIDIYKAFLKEQLAKHKVTNDGLPQHGLVNAELFFFSQELKQLNVVPADQLEVDAMNDIWSHQNQ